MVRGTRFAPAPGSQTEAFPTPALGGVRRAPGSDDRAPPNIVFVGLLRSEALPLTQGGRETTLGGVKMSLSENMDGSCGDNMRTWSCRRQGSDCERRCPALIQLTRDPSRRSEPGTMRLLRSSRNRRRL